ncbi:DNA polymerase I family protein with 3'-5'-exonuclease and polymerase domains [Thermanaerovibrio velox DSM 12556]|uniref:DNA-directed DNA polymerase n=1 Tax=Thermanaerovibrio velox DSM 12556 TaxID=926567 RepID=H0US09_9BACT|nr:DNA polymerase [Thermanaerovibrio velox]EHM10098.1 DNA polymerase I family protein with 3'-5'-exonuclease and polymerase domains [Thermanaerovibrio velox DSM 12556]
MSCEEKFLLVDGHGLAFRAFYALPNLSAPDGTPVNAVVGFFNMLYKILDDQNPTRWAVFFDPPGPVARKEVFDKYKEGRRPTPEGFKVQLPIIKDVLGALGHRVYEREGEEADDVIAATARELSSHGEVIILSADKDLFQVIGPNVVVCRPVRGVSEFKVYDRDVFVQEYGFEPHLMVDYLALTGDSVDNIPGVKGIGDKGARELVAALGSIENIYHRIQDLPKAKRVRLEEGRDMAFLSKKLIVPGPSEPVPLEGLIPMEPDEARAKEIFERLALRQLASRLGLSEPGGNKVSSRKSGDDRGSTREVSLSVMKDFRRLGVFGAWGAGGLGFDVRMLSQDGATWTGRLSPSELLEVLRRKEVLTWDYKGLVAALGAVPEWSSVLDLRLCYYAFHPDRTGQFEERFIPEVMNSEENPYELMDVIFSDPRWPAARDMVFNVDHPLSMVLLDMEQEGIGVDLAGLKKLSVLLRERMKVIEDEVAKSAGTWVNLQSPKQVGWLLFEKLQLPALKRTKTGFSTDVGVLEELSRLPGHLGEVPSLLLEHRETSKLLTGFVNPFIELGSSGRIRSTFEQAGTGTGRLSSRDPNVQNLPQFGKWALEFRRALRPAGEGRVFLAADYSQIELRVLAHLSKEERLIDVFLQGADVHARTASWIYGIEQGSVSPEQRRFAKVVNFGLLYGMGVHGLAQRMGVPRSQAAEIIRRYFEALPGIKEYISRVVHEAKSRGYARTLMGRVRPLDEVATVEGRGAGAIDRVAINTPIQGSAADIARKAMVDLWEAVKGEDCKLVLQVHDSIVCSVKEKDADRFSKVIKDVMEGAVPLDVPLKVEVKIGRTMGDI